MAKLSHLAVLLSTMVVGWTLSPRRKPKATALRIGVVTDPLGKQDSQALRYLILHLNTVQQTFEFQFVSSPPEDPLISLLARPPRHRASRSEIAQGRFLEAFGERMRSHLESENADFNCQEPPPTRFIVLSTAHLQDNWYSMRKPDQSPLVALVALGGWKRTMAPPTEVELFIAVLLRQAAALAIPSMDRSMHFGTKGCLFDFNQELRDVRYKTLNAFVCEHCAGVIAESEYPDLATDLPLALGKEWLGSFDDPASPASIAAKLGHNLFVNKGLTTTAFEKIVTALPTESLKLLYSIVGSVVAGAVGAWLALKFGLPPHAK